MDRPITRLRAVEIGVSMSGIAKPIGIIDPVTLGNETITRAVFPNAAFLREHDVRIGDAIAIQPGNGSGYEIAEVMPNLRTGEERAVQMPYVCPRCSCDLRQSGADLVCPSAGCPEQLKERIARIKAPEAFDMPEFDDETVEKLITAGLLNTPADLFKVRERELVRAGWTLNGARELVAAVHRAKNVSLDRLLVAMTGIESAAAHSIAVHARSLARVKRLVAGSMARLPNVGTPVAESVSNFMREPRNRKILAQMARAGVVTARMPAGGS
jgi:DNA ligase (NAD+)